MININLRDISIFFYFVTLNIAVLSRYRKSGRKHHAKMTFFNRPNLNVFKYLELCVELQLSNLSK